MGQKTLLTPCQYFRLKAWSPNKKSNDEAVWRAFYVEDGHCPSVIHYHENDADVPSGGCYCWKMLKHESRTCLSASSNKSCLSYPQLLITWWGNVYTELDVHTLHFTPGALKDKISKNSFIYHDLGEIISKLPPKNTRMKGELAIETICSWVKRDLILLK